MLQKDIEVIFEDPIERNIFIDLYEVNKVKNVSRGLEIGKDLRISTKIKGSLIRSNSSTNSLKANNIPKSPIKSSTSRDGSSSRLTNPRFF